MNEYKVFYELKSVMFPHNLIQDMDVVRAISGNKAIEIVKQVSEYARIKNGIDEDEFVLTILDVEKL